MLVDSEREISRVTSSLDLCHAEGGFVRPECYNQYVSWAVIMRAVSFAPKTGAHEVSMSVCVS